MEILRMGHDVWGQRVIEGISWQLLPVAFGIGVVVVVGHLLYKLVRGNRKA
jgi:hypothetical protein